MSGRRVIGILIVAFLLFPFLALFARASSVRFPLDGETARVFAATALQALASASISLVFGILGGLGLLWSARRPRSAAGAEALAVLPNAVPVLLLLLAVNKLFPWARGLGGIVFVHALLNVGLIASAFKQLVEKKIAGMAELAYVEGSGGWRFFTRVALPVLRADLLLLALFVFALCFTSFAVPLALGGSRATTVEVLIYQKIRIGGEWADALGLAFMQMLAVLAFVWSLQSLQAKSESAPAVFRRTSTPLLVWAPGLAFAFLPAVVLATGLVTGLGAGLEQLRALPELLVELPALAAGSLVIGTTTGILTVALLVALAFARPAGVFRRFLTGYAAPSSVLVGFAILIAWRSPGLASLFKIAFGLALIALPSFYRYQWRALLDALGGQITVARTLGAGDSLIFRRVVLPQLIRPACRISGMAALWAWGDFALSSVLAERSLTLAMAAQSLMGSYRLDGATVLVWGLIGGGLLTYAAFVSLGEGVGYVLGSESET